LDAVLSIVKQVQARKSKNLVAIGINCIHPSHVTNLFTEVSESVKKLNVPLVVYPNSGGKYLADKITQSMKMKISNISSFQKFTQSRTDGMERMTAFHWKNMRRSG
jgi:S-methylmethionine-dependent homocysteine/selenocysteine methylase